MSKLKEIKDILSQPPIALVIVISIALAVIMIFRIWWAIPAFIIVYLGIAILNGRID